MLQKLKQWWKADFVSAWAYAKFIGGAAIAALPVIAGLISDPDVHAQIMSFVQMMPSQKQGLVLMGLAVVTYLAKPHTSGS